MVQLQCLDDGSRVKLFDHSCLLWLLSSMVQLDHKPALLYLPPREGIALLLAWKLWDPNKNGLLWLTEAAFSNQLEIKEKTPRCARQHKREGVFMWKKSLFLTQASWMTDIVSIETRKRRMGLCVCGFLCVLLHSSPGFWLLGDSAH